MARNMQKMIGKNRGRLPERYCMTVKEFKALADVAKQGTAFPLLKILSSMDSYWGAVQRRAAISRKGNNRRE